MKRVEETDVERRLADAGNGPRLMSGELENLAASVARLAAPVFKEAAWGWRDIGVPDAAQIASCVSRLIREGEEGSEDGRTLATGRFTVDRYVEDGRHICDVSLRLGSIVGAEPKPKAGEVDG